MLEIVHIAQGNTKYKVFYKANSMPFKGPPILYLTEEGHFFNHTVAAAADLNHKREGGASRP